MGSTLTQPRALKSTENLALGYKELPSHECAKICRARTVCYQQDVAVAEREGWPERVLDLV